MEDVFRRSGHGDLPKEKKSADDYSSAGYHHHEVACREEVLAKVGGKRAYHENSDDLKSSLSEHDKDLSLTKQVVVADNKERSTMESESKASSSSQKEQDNWLESARAEVGEVREENQRLKMHLGQVMKDYQALQVKFYDIIRQEETKKSTSSVDNYQQAVEESELVSLSLGRFSSESKKDGKSKTYSNGKDDETANNEGDLSLGLDCQFEASKSHNANGEPLANPISPINSLEDQPKEEATETWPPPKVPKTTMPGGGDNEVIQQNPLKKARVCVRARCDTPTMNDGCQWRKYGQKISKGNPCPRAYYRCTVAPSCPVRKQVQRCAEDLSILVTTYEGTHNHKLPLAATAMASTTSAAASMLLSGSSSSSSRTVPNPSSTTAAGLHGLNFYLSDNSNSKQFYLHNSSLSASPSHPTITLDLTANASSSQFNRFYSNNSPILKSTPTGLNFSSAESKAMPWGNGLLSYGSASQPYNRNQLGTLTSSGRPPMENSHCQPYMQKKTASTPQQPLPDTIAAATKAITADPNFQSALAAAFMSIIGSGGENLGGGDNFAQKLKWGEHFPVASGNSSLPTPKGNNIACATSYLNQTTSANSQAGNLMFLPPSLPFASPKSASASPGDNRDSTN
ncbi:hypothetical protein P3X46_023293 [Hevea brasiliensis]|uniref:WRKY domain-containing protein n=1 Tax=Hevea brasiliensis TaxID=3981 RepID=A0ABQ9LAK6_HEVBR|nr:WRKY transcription factor 72B-like [Hevea brasiliensis]KAJ9163646.1 hypothetical protein P3X46_023293 [Hevea brasiliensis]